MVEIIRAQAQKRAQHPSFWGTYGLAFVQPKRAFEVLLATKNPLSWGALSVAIAASNYSLVYFFLSRNGGRPTVFTPWLAIPAERYYHYNFIFHVPSVLLAWVAAGGFTQLAARLLGGRGTFENTLAGLGLGIGVAQWTTGLHDLTTTFLGYVGPLDQRAYEDAMSNSGTAPYYLINTLMFLYLVAFLVAFTLGVATSHRLLYGRAAVAGSFGFVVYQLIYVLFNR